MGRFTFCATPLAGLLAVERQRAVDERGFFSRFFCADDFASAGFDAAVAQMNQTLTRRAGAIRGLHFQYPPHAEIKIVTCLRGRVFDVAVDLRQGSPTFLAWHGEILSADNARSLFIPRGFAHGFQTLTPDCELLYLHSVPYVAAAEGALNALDPRLAIEWPLALTDISERDRSHPPITADFPGIAS